MTVWDACNGWRRNCKRVLLNDYYSEPSILVYPGSDEGLPSSSVQADGFGKFNCWLLLKSVN